ncbi:serine hydrolase domain-containing protein [Brevibacterium sp. UMB1308A]|uniref:serine hydrolase domain-containing protein n=1 Tax=Brevibacterium sp. UMB1308A TaxID=3050608 RepID=UPI00254D5F49|nr:serine hydrolase domain-containing protein [Brevibacterium sp. UMB1308A]MDK8346810.1 serine hydrolase domain-containing protein [Brevibacterium sp. UMB1308B]MDK8713921.1 serine hydrolase domain-containing protein [Brevibacterium sp. UMB1308A]
MSFAPSVLTQVCEELEAEASAGGVTQLAYGIVSGGQLVAQRDPDAIFRIASMTKSFTAAAVLGVCRGVIPVSGTAPSLDDELVDWLPDLRESQWATGMTVRDALTMSTGLPNDDPWADRLESLSDVGMRDLMRQPAGTNFVTGTGYEYANYGYALLGAFVEAATGREFTEVVATHLLTPLGLESTGFDVRELDPGRLVTGYRKNLAGELEPQPFTLPGAFSAIGGLASSVADVARWISVLMTAVDGSAVVGRVAGEAAGLATVAGEAGGEGGSDLGEFPLGANPREQRTWRRILADLQQAQRLISVTRNARDAVVTAGYGYGLRCYFDTQLGHSAGHSGGYPGFSLHMRWHAASGTGVVLLANVTGFPAEAVATNALDALVSDVRDRGDGSVAWPRAEAVEATPARKGAGASGAGVGASGGGAAGAGAGDDDAGAGVVYAVDPVCSFAPSEEARERAAQAERMIAACDDSGADQVFSGNMDMDVPRSERLTHWAEVREYVGGEGSVAAGLEGIEVTWINAHEATWKVWGAERDGQQRGREVTMKLNAAGLIQKLKVKKL